MTVESKFRTISNTIEKVIPVSVFENLHFANLFEAYYRFCEETGQYYKESRLLADSIDISTADEKYLKSFKSEMMRLFPDDIHTNLRFFLQFTHAFYNSKGSLDSFKFLFKVLYDSDDVDITYPSEYILKTSDGEWSSRFLMKIENFFDLNSDGELDTSESIIGKSITGLTSKASAFISDIVSYDANMIELHLELLDGEFQLDEIVKISSLDPANPLKLSARVIPSLSSYKIIDGGSGYIANKKINIKSPGDGYYFSAKIGSVDPLTGKILSIEILDSGYNYLYDMPELNLDDILMFNTDEYLQDVPYYANQNNNPSYYQECECSILSPVVRYTSVFRAHAQKRKVATIELINQAVYKESGQYNNARSFLSDDWKLHDGYFYQEYSYVINTNIDFAKFKKPITDLVHPAGTKMFYENSGINDLSIDVRNAPVSIEASALADACQFGKLFPALENNPPTYPNWTADKIGWNQDQDVLKISVYGSAAHFNQAAKIRIYVNDNLNTQTSTISETTIKTSNDSVVIEAMSILGHPLPDFNHTKDPTLASPAPSSWQQNGNNNWHGVIEIPSALLTEGAQDISLTGTVIFPNRILAFPDAIGLYTNAGIMCGTFLTQIPDKTILWDSLPEPTPTPTPTPTPIPAGPADVQLDDFDYAVVEYSWTGSNGVDLDTRTYILSPDRKINTVGWNRLANDEEYLTWGGDNTSYGSEAIMCNVSLMKTAFIENEIKISLNAFWFRMSFDRMFNVSFKTYKNGSMVKNGFTWTNSGGQAVQILNFQTMADNSLAGADIDGFALGEIIYTRTTDSFTLRKY